MGTMQRCRYCELKLDSVQNKVTTTEDGHKVCIDCYYKIFAVIFKGQFTYEEGVNALHLRAKYEQTLGEYLLKVKKLAKANSETYKTALDKILLIEDKLCLVMFNADREAVTKDISKHYNIVKTILTNNLLDTMFTTVNINGISISSYNIDYEVRLLDTAYKDLGLPM